MDELAPSVLEWPHLIQGDGCGWDCARTVLAVSSSVAAVAMPMQVHRRDVAGRAPVLDKGD